MKLDGSLRYGYAQHMRDGLGDDVLKQIAVELPQQLRKSLTVDWAVRDTVRAKMRVMGKHILKLH